MSPVPLDAPSVRLVRFSKRDRVVVFPSLVERIERQLADAQTLPGTIAHVRSKTEYVVALDAGGRYYANVAELRAE